MDDLTAEIRESVALPIARALLHAGAETPATRRLIDHLKENTGRLDVALAIYDGLVAGVWRRLLLDDDDVVVRLSEFAAYVGGDLGSEIMGACERHLDWLDAEDADALEIGVKTRFEGYVWDVSRMERWAVAA